MNALGASFLFSLGFLVVRFESKLPFFFFFFLSFKLVSIFLMALNLKGMSSFSRWWLKRIMLDYSPNYSIQSRF